MSDNYKKDDNSFWKILFATTLSGLAVYFGTSFLERNGSKYKSKYIDEFVRKILKEYDLRSKDKTNDDYKLN